MLNWIVGTTATLQNRMACDLGTMQFSYPATVVLEGKRLADAKARLSHGDHELLNTLGMLTAQADKWLCCGPWTVTSKKFLPPSGDKHDYASQAPYWWPSADGGPYFRRDGEQNPECKLYTDKDDRERVFRSSYVLALAWYYTSNEAYADHAGKILRTWFVSPKTRMNPNLNHAQIIPGANDGRAIGIIEFSQGYSSVLDAVAILKDAPGWTTRDADDFREWNCEFLKWLDGEFGTEESKERNNHGTFALMQRAAISLFIGDKAQARKELLSMQAQIDEQIAADGSQPLELKRTRSWHYSIFNLVAYTRGASIGKKLGVDLWNYEGPQGCSINRAVDFLVPYAIGDSETKWMFPELMFDAFSANDIIHAAADAGNKRAKAAVGKLPACPEGDLWKLRPAVEQLDPEKMAVI